MPPLATSPHKKPLPNLLVRSQLDLVFQRFHAHGLLLILGVILASIVGCQPTTQNTQKTTQSSTDLSSNNIVTTSYPLQWVTQQITGDNYQVDFHASDSSHPDRWRPDRETIAEIQAADLIVCNGIAAPYANWMKTVSLPSSKVIESASKGMSLSDFISVEDIRLVHSHGPEGEHSHPTMVSRTWLSPSMLSKQASFIAKELSKRFPNDASTFQQNLTVLQKTLKSSVPQSLLATQLVFSATPELKFLTKTVGIEDSHFNWNENTTLTEVEASFASQPQGVASNFILFPRRLEALADRIQPVLQKRKLTPIFIDMLDQPDPNRDFMTRLKTNFERMQKLTAGQYSNLPVK